MKKIATLLLFFAAVFSTANAQFEQGKKYVGASVSGLGLSYSSNEKFNMGLNAHAGYFIADCLMANATIGYEHKHDFNDVSLGAGLRYYFDQNGIFLGAGAEYCHIDKSNNDVFIPVTAGYAFFINRYLTIEPSVYYKMSLHDFGGNSTVGFNIGLGFYF